MFSGSTFPACLRRAGQVTAPPRSVMNSRRLIVAPRLKKEAACHACGAINRLPCLHPSTELTDPLNLMHGIK